MWPARAVRGKDLPLLAKFLAHHASAVTPGGEMSMLVQLPAADVS
jgi:hypothetical protein